MWDILKQGAVVVCLRTPPEYHLSWFSWMLSSTLQRRTNRVEQQPHSTLLHVPACLVVAHPPFLVTLPSCFFFFFFFFLQSTFGIGDSRSVTTFGANRGPVGVMRCSAVNKECQDGWFAGTQHWTERVYVLRCILELSPPCDLHK